MSESSYVVDEIEYLADGCWVGWDVSSVRGLEFDWHDEFVSVRCVSVAVGSKDQRNLSGIDVPSGPEGKSGFAQGDVYVRVEFDICDRSFAPKSA